MAEALAHGARIGSYEVLDRPLPIPELLDLGAQLANGLAKAHRAGIVLGETATGRPLFRRDPPAQVLAAVIERDPPARSPRAG